MKGPGDTFDVSWSHDGALLSACFSSGTLVVQDASVYKDVQFGSTLIAHENLESVAETVEHGKAVTPAVPSTSTHVSTSKGSKHGASAASRSHALAHHASHADSEVASSGSRSVGDKGEKGEKVTELKTDKGKGRSDSVVTAGSTTTTTNTAVEMKVDGEEAPAVENEATTEVDAMQVDGSSSSAGDDNGEESGYADKEDFPAPSLDETPMDEVAASTAGENEAVNDMVMDEIVDGKDKEDTDL